MGKTATPYCLYEEGKVIDDAEYTVFEYTRWQSYRSVLTLIIGSFTAANIVGVIIASREKWASMVNYVERILTLKKRDPKAVKHVGTGFLDDTGIRVRWNMKQGRGRKE